MNVVVFSHEQDVDGIFSAAIVKLAYPNCKVILTNYGLDKMNAMAETIRLTAAEGPGTIIISDIGVNEESYTPVLHAIEFAMERGSKCIWIDHHIWPEGPRNLIGSFCELVLFPGQDGVKKCSSDLCAERFAPENAYALQLAMMAHRTDFPDSARFPIPPFAALISYYLGFPELREALYSVILDNVVKGVLWNSRMQADVITASAMADESMSKSIDGLVQKEFALAGHPTRVTVAIVKADEFVNRSMLLGKIMDSGKAHVAIAYTDDGKVSFRRSADAPSTIDCSKIALRFREGGGHIGAAGGFLNSIPNKSGDEAAVLEIVEALESYFPKAT